MNGQNNCFLQLFFAGVVMGVFLFTWLILYVRLHQVSLYWVQGSPAGLGHHRKREKNIPVHLNLIDLSNNCGGFSALKAL